MHPEHVSSKAPLHLLVESKSESHEGQGPGAATRFLHAARSLAAAGTPTVVYLIDDGVNCAMGARPDMAGLIKAGASVWADDVSLAQRAISADQLIAGVVAADMDKVAPLLFDPAVRVVWH